MAIRAVTDQPIEDAMALKVQGGATKSILKCGDVMGFQHEYLTRSNRLEKLCNIAEGHGVKGFGLSVFAGVREIGHHRSDTRCAVVPQISHEHQQSTQLVLRALGQATVQAVHHKGIPAGWITQGPELVLPVIETTVLVRSQGDAQFLRQRLPKRCVGVQ